MFTIVCHTNSDYHILLKPWLDFIKDFWNKVDIIILTDKDPELGKGYEFIKIVRYDPQSQYILERFHDVLNHVETKYVCTFKDCYFPINLTLNDINKLISAMEKHDIDIMNLIPIPESHRYKYRTGYKKGQNVIVYPHGKKLKHDNIAIEENLGYHNHGYGANIYNTNSEKIISNKFKYLSYSENECWDVQKYVLDNFKTFNVYNQSFEFVKVIVFGHFYDFIPIKYPEIKIALEKYKIDINKNLGYSWKGVN